MQKSVSAFFFSSQNDPPTQTYFGSEHFSFPITFLQNPLRLISGTVYFVAQFSHFICLDAENHTWEHPVAFYDILLASQEKQP